MKMKIMRENEKRGNKEITRLVVREGNGKEKAKREKNGKRKAWKE